MWHYTGESPPSGVRFQRWSWDTPGIKSQTQDTQHSGHCGSGLLLHRPCRLLDQLDDLRKTQHRPWEAPLKVLMNSHTSLCQLLIYQLMLQQLAIRVIRTEGENRRAWRKTPRMIGVPPTNFPHHLTVLPRQTLDIILSLLHTSDIASQASSLRPVCTLLLAYDSLRLMGTKDISGGVYLFLGKVTCLGIKLAVFSRENSHENIEFSLFCTKWPYLIEK